MIKTLLLLLVLASSHPLFSRVLSEKDESRTLDEAMKIVERAKKDRKDFNLEDEKVKREIATEKDPKFRRAFEKLMKDLEL
jgi:hypothetical protein